MGSLNKIKTIKEPETQIASPASQQSGKLTKISASGGTAPVKITEAWRTATPAQTKVPEKSSPLLTKTVQQQAGAGRGGKVSYRDVEMPTLAGRLVKMGSGAAKGIASNLSSAATTLYETGQKSRNRQNQEELDRYQAYAAGISPEKFLEFKRATDGLSADQVNGKTVSGSKKAKVLAAIDAMEITDSQKTALYYAAGYKESTLDDAPWYGRPDSDIMPKLGGGSLTPLRQVSGGRLTPVDDIMPKLVK